MFTGVEIIKRKDAEKLQKDQINGNLQVSYNDYGHLVLRIIDSYNGDSLVVLSQGATNQVIKFIENYLCKSTTNINISNLHIDKNDIPF